jgi:hypothetical protein
MAKVMSSTKMPKLFDILVNFQCVTRERKLLALLSGTHYLVKPYSRSSEEKIWVG